MEAEQFTADLPVAARRQLALPQRLADTTARDALCQVSLDEVRSVLHRLVRSAWRRKALIAALPEHTMNLRAREVCAAVL